MSAARRRLTDEEALAGVQPPRLTKAEWHQMWYGSMNAAADARSRSTILTRAATPAPCSPLRPVPRETHPAAKRAARAVAETNPDHGAGRGNDCERVPHHRT